MSEFEKMFGPPEALKPELARFLVESHLGPVIKHPLLYHFAIDVEKGYARHVNMAHGEKLQVVRHARRVGEWLALMWSFERPHRIPLLVRMREKILAPKTAAAEELYWHCVHRAWVDAEFPHQHGDEELRTLFALVKRPGRIVSERRSRDTGLMTPDEMGTIHAQETYQVGTRLRIADALGFDTKATSGGSVTVYRGFAGKDKFAEGWSWTISYERAQWFARRFQRGNKKPGKVAVGEVFLSDVIAYFTGRSESEIVADPDAVMVSKIERVP